MHFRKAYLIKRTWTFCPHLVQSFKVFGAFQWHWTKCPVPLKLNCYHDNLVEPVWCWSNWPAPLQYHKESHIQCVLGISLCTYVHVHSIRRPDFGCSQSGNSQFSWLIQNAGCRSYRCVQFEHTYFGPIKRCAWRIFAVANVRISYIRTQQKGQVLLYRESSL